MYRKMLRWCIHIGIFLVGVFLSLGLFIAAVCKFIRYEYKEESDEEDYERTIDYFMIAGLLLIVTLICLALWLRCKNSGNKQADQRFQIATSSDRALIKVEMIASTEQLPVQHPAKQSPDDQHSPATPPPQPASNPNIQYS